MKKLFAVCFALVLLSCSSKSNDNPTSEGISTENESVESNEEGHIEDNETNDQDYSDECKFDDGTYSATVDYYNPETNYSNTYTLDVEVENCQVIQINFPNDGYLDEDHISAADLDEDGNASVDGENGKTYEVQIDY
jgi:hypothetical protein